MCVERRYKHSCEFSPLPRIIRRHKSRRSLRCWPPDVSTYDFVGKCFECGFIQNSLQTSRRSCGRPRSAYRLALQVLFAPRRACALAVGSEFQVCGGGAGWQEKGFVFMQPQETRCTPSAPPCSLTQHQVGERSVVSRCSPTSPSFLILSPVFLPPTPSIPTTLHV